ncbi:MAG: hypothetical protein JWP12_1949 [Bacteroidetes bacterium]|nr:hypothetical protein [Bacteroidota bacterium]
MGIFIGIVVTVLLLMLCYLLYSAMKDGWYLLLHVTGLQKLFIRVQDLETVNSYVKNIPYYMRLSEEGKGRFVNRLFIFMNNKEFVGMHGLMVTEEMKVLISASAVQLTFGLTKYNLSNLETIVIFPDIFTLGGAKTEYKGATSQGRMYLSWKAFREGNENATDKVNLGLHEMTHALKLSLSVGAGFDVYFANRIDIWESMAEGELEKLRSKAEEFLRPYGKTNMAEFFAVCAEAFFENPNQFSTQLPELYNYIVFLLNQDPTNVNNDYTVAPGYFELKSFNIPTAAEVKPSYKYSSWHWSLSLLLFGVLGGIVTILFLMHQLILPYWFYFAAVLVIGTIGLLQKRYFEERNIFSGAFFLLYSYVGFGVTITTLLLWINFFIPVTAPQTEEFRIISYSESWITSYGKYSTHSSHSFVGYQLEVEDADWYNSKLLLLKTPPKTGQLKVAFIYRRGLLGIKNLEGYYYITEKE